MRKSVARTAILVATAITATLVSSIAVAGDSGYKLAAQVHVGGGDTGWDLAFVDSAAHRLYLSHGDHVEVVDTESSKVIDKIEGMQSVHQIAIASEFSRGFISDGKGGAAVIFDTKTLQFIDRVAAGEKPDAILYDAFTKRVFVFNSKSADATAIDAATGKSVGTVKLGGGPELPVSDGKGIVFVNLEAESQLVAFDARTLTVTHTWPLAPGKDPTGLAMDTQTRRLFSACGNKKLVVINADTGAVITTLPIGDRVDGAAFDPVRKMIFTSNGDGTLTIIHEDTPDTYHVVENLPTKPGARTIALDEATGAIYLPTADYGPPPPAADEKTAHRPRPLPDTFKYLRIEPPKN